MLDCGGLVFGLDVKELCGVYVLWVWGVLIWIGYDVLLLDLLFGGVMVVVIIYVVIFKINFEFVEVRCCGIFVVLWLVVLVKLMVGCIILMVIGMYGKIMMMLMLIVVL